jgi:hypothetical protein
VTAITVETNNRNAADSIIHPCYSRRRTPRRPAVWRQWPAPPPVSFIPEKRMVGQPRRLAKLMLRFDRRLRLDRAKWPGADRELAGAVAASQAER